MTNLLSLKTVAWNNGKKKLVSPQQTGFEWEMGIVQAGAEDVVDLRSTQGIYTSPNPEALDEYMTHVTSIIALVNLYGWADIWTGPHDLEWTYVSRSWGARIIALVANDVFSNMDGRRQLMTFYTTQAFHLPVFSWQIARAMVQETWISLANIDPFEDSRCK